MTYKKMQIDEFVKWYEGAYNSCDMNVSVLRTRAAFLDGYAAAIDKPTDPDNECKINAAQLLRQCADSLRGAANVIETMLRAGCCRHASVAEP